jgi:hypothetical protein
MRMIRAVLLVPRGVGRDSAARIVRAALRLCDQHGLTLCCVARDVQGVTDAITTGAASRVITLWPDRRLTATVRNAGGYTLSLRPAIPWQRDTLTATLDDLVASGALDEVVARRIMDAAGAAQGGESGPRRRPHREG